MDKSSPVEVDTGKEFINPLLIDCFIPTLKVIMKNLFCCFPLVCSLVLLPHFAHAEQPGVIIELSSIGVLTLVLAVLSMSVKSSRPTKLGAFLKHFRTRR